MVKAFAARLRRIADRLDPPVAPLVITPGQAKTLYAGMVATADGTWRFTSDMSGTTGGGARSTVGYRNTLGG